MRGAVPLALFGPKGYGAVLGVLATPYLLLAAVAPAAFAIVVERYGYAAGEAVLLGAGLLSFLGMEVMAHGTARGGGSARGRSTSQHEVGARGRGLSTPVVSLSNHGKAGRVCPSTGSGLGWWFAQAVVSALAPGYTQSSA